MPVVNLAARAPLKMKMALKYGLLITAVVVVWVSFTRLIFPLPPESKANALAPILFNLAAIVAIYLGMKARKELAGGISFKEGLMTGLSIAFVYALTSSLFFVILLLAVGAKIMANEPMAATHPMWQVAIMAFAGIFLGSLILGLVYSTVISFILAKRRRREL
jgi:hypothetical protein